MRGGPAAGAGADRPRAARVSAAADRARYSDSTRQFVSSRPRVGILPTLPLKRVARPAGIEPATPAFGGQYSIH